MSDMPFLDPDASRDYLRTWMDGVERRAADTRALSDRLEQLRVSAEDGNRLAEVTIDSSGVLVDLKLTERIHQFAPDVVSRAVLAALRTARTKAAALTREIAEETMGPGSLVARTIADRMQEQLERPDSGKE